MASYYYRQLSTPEQLFYKKTVDAIQHRKSASAAPWGMQTEQVENTVKAIMLDRPELFYVDFRTTNTVHTAGMVTYEIRYMYPVDQIRTYIDRIETCISALLVGSDRVTRAPDLDKLRWIHNMIVKNVVYDDAAAAQGFGVYEAHTIVGVFEKRTAVCEGIAKAVSLLGDRLGMELPVVCGDGTNGEIDQIGPHAWNLVQIDGKFAHLDVTWDMCMSVASRCTRYDYFCLPDTHMRRDHRYDGLPRCCEDSGLSYFEKAGSYLHNTKELGDFLDRKLSGKRKSLYFKVAFSKALGAPELQRIDDLVLRKVSACNLLGVRLEMMGNAPQGVFYYKIHSLFEKR